MNFGEHNRRLGQQRKSSVAEHPLKHEDHSVVFVKSNVTGAMRSHSLEYVERRSRFSVTVTAPSTDLWLGFRLSELRGCASLDVPLGLMYRATGKNS